MKQQHFILVILGLFVAYVVWKQYQASTALGIKQGWFGTAKPDAPLRPEDYGSN